MALTAADLDAQDPLAEYAVEFYKTPGQIYLDGNSLGLLCKPAEASLNQAIDAWRTRAIQGWTEGPEPWFEMSRKVAALLAPILGAESADVMVGQSTTVNLHQILATYYDPNGPKPRILIDEWCFPSDRYAVASHLRLRGRDAVNDLVVAPYQEHLLTDSDLLSRMTDGVGLAILPSVVYRTGQMLDTSYLTWEARARGVVIAWDCSHSAGVVPHSFWRDEIDLAFGCTYKYLNGGPGAVGWLYAHPWFRECAPGLAGWFGCDPSRQFEMASEFHPASSASRFQIGTPHVLSLAPLIGALELIGRATVPAIRAKSELQMFFLHAEIWSRPSLRRSLEVVTPLSHDCRGGHIALVHPAARKLSEALRHRGVIPDFRPPDLLRLAPAPLYTSFAECMQAIDILEDILNTRAHEQLPDGNALVT
jgi:kynureninase